MAWTLKLCPSHPVVQPPGTAIPFSRGRREGVGGPNACWQRAWGVAGPAPLAHGQLSSGHGHGLPVPQLPVTWPQLSWVCARVAWHHCPGQMWAHGRGRGVPEGHLPLRGHDHLGVCVGAPKVYWARCSGCHQVVVVLSVAYSHHCPVPSYLCQGVICMQCCRPYRRTGSPAWPWWTCTQPRARRTSFVTCRLSSSPSRHPRRMLGHSWPGSVTTLVSCLSPGCPQSVATLPTGCWYPPLCYAGTCWMA